MCDERHIVMVEVVMRDHSEASRVTEPGLVTSHITTFVTRHVTGALCLRSHAINGQLVLRVNNQTLRIKNK